MWRLTWIAHALRNSPLDLFDANVFYPASRTLAMSDATMLQGIAAAPLLWAGVSPVVVYNLLILGGIAGSGLAMFLLARSVTHATGPALVAAAVFTMGPYRIEHFMHLELQWAMWMPLALWAVHQAIDRGSWRFGLLVGLFLWLQILSSVYYAMFLAITLAVFVPVMLFRRSTTQLTRSASGLLLGAISAAMLTAPYAIPYLENAEALGNRPVTEMLTYSARPISYLASPPQNWLWGWTADWGGPELHLFPGAIAIVLSVVAAWHPARRVVVAYALVALAGIELSFGPHGMLYAWLLDNMSMLHGLRSPSRFGIVVLCGIAVLSALGTQVVQRRFARDNARRALAFAAAVLILLTVEYANTGMTLATVAPDPPESRNVYATLRALGPGVVLELPQPRPNRLPGYDPWYAYWSRSHWYPLVNGYSGYYPPDYGETLEHTARFPDRHSIGYLRHLGVRYILVHKKHFENDEEFVDLVMEMSKRAEIQRFGKFQAPHGDVELFLLNAGH